MRWLAALLSLPLPGLGHALAGTWRRALLIAGLGLLAQVVFALVQAAPEVTPALLRMALLWLIVMAGAVVAAAADAWRVARAPVGGWRWRLGLCVAVVALNLGMVVLPGEPVAWRSYYAPSGSMLPTLGIGERFIVQDGWYEAHAARRGEVAVFTLPPAETAYVKRIIGLPGDRVRMAAGRLVLNGAVVPMSGDGARREMALPDGPRVTVLKSVGGGGAADETAEFLVPAAHVFVMGDNLDNSYDSRLNPAMRFVPVSALVGRAAIIYWPPEGFGRVVR